MAFQIPDNAARDKDGNLANPAAWGVVPGQSAQPGTFDPANKPQINWDTLGQTGFGGMYGGMDPGELQGIINRSKQNYNSGILDSNAISYLNNRNTLQNMGLVGQGQEADLNSLFGGDADQQNLKFAAFQGGGNGGEGYDVGFKDVNGTTNANLAKMMQALGGGQGYNLGDYMTGFNGTPNYSMFGGLSASGVANQLRNGNFTDALQSIRQQIGSGNGGQMGPNPATNPFSKYETNPWQGNAGQGVNVDNGNRNPAGQPAGQNLASPTMVQTNGSGAPAGGGVRGQVQNPGAGTAYTGDSGMRGGGAGDQNNPGNPFYSGQGAAPQPNNGMQTPAIGPYVPGPNPNESQGDTSMRGGDGGYRGGGSTGAQQPTNYTGTNRNPFNSYVNGQSGGSLGGGQNSSYNPGGLQAGGTPQNSGSLSGYGSLLNNLSSGQGISPTGFMGQSRHANNSMWGR